VAPPDYEAISFGEQKASRLHSSVAHLRRVIAAAGLDRNRVLPH
jgi:hypothetical protein